MQAAARQQGERMLSINTEIDMITCWCVTRAHAPCKPNPPWPWHPCACVPHIQAVHARQPCSRAHPTPQRTRTATLRAAKQSQGQHQQDLEPAYDPRDANKSIHPEAPASLKASLQVVSRQGTALQAANNPLKGFFIKCKLAW